MDYKIGQIVETKIIGIQPYGIFVQLGEDKGLIHISECTGEYIKHIDRSYHIGDAIKAMVIDNDGDISLSIRALTELNVSKIHESPIPIKIKQGYKKHWTSSKYVTGFKSLKDFTDTINDNYK